MARTVSLNMRQAMNAATTDEVPVILTTISHPTLATPIRFSTDNTTRIITTPLTYATISRGQSFIFVPMSVILPDDKHEAPPQARLVVDNINREMIRTVRSTSLPAVVQMEMVMSGTPNSVEIDFPDMDLVACDYDQFQMTLTLEINSLQNEPIPAGTFNPSGFPALF
jgi:uncharacterized protein DUF1833